MNLFWDFSASIQSENIKKLKERPFEFFFRKKSRSARKNERGDLLVSPGIVCYAERGKTFLGFSSLGQMEQFGTIKFCKLFKNYFGQFVWIEKKSL